MTTGLAGKALTSHASTGIRYVQGNASNFVHVKVSDNYTSSADAASTGVAASSQAVYNAYNVLNSDKAASSHTHNTITLRGETRTINFKLLLNNTILKIWAGDTSIGQITLSK